MFKGVFYFFKGYVIIKVTGKFPERVLNVASKKNVLCWDIRPTKNSMVMKISARDLKAMEEISEGCNCKIHHMAKIGLPFTAKRHKKRHALLWGVGGFMCILLALFSLLWDISITGLETIPDQTIFELLEQSGIKKGRLVYGIDTRQACKEIIAKNDKIAWIGIEIRGSCALVEVVEKVQKPEIKDTQNAYNIISDKNGVIDSMQVRSGVPVVNVGDAVFEGSLIVSGIADSTAVGARYLPADADIIMRVWHEKQVTEPLYIIERIPTEQKKSRISLNLFKKQIPLYFGKEIPYTTYDITHSFWGIFKKETITEIKEKKVPVSEQNAIINAKKNFEQELKSFGEIVNITYSYEKQGDALNIHFTAEVKEKAGKKQEIERIIQDGENPAN